MAWHFPAKKEKSGSGEELAEEVAITHVAQDKPIQTAPIQDMDPELRKCCRFHLANSEHHHHVVLLVSFAEGTSEEQVAAVKKGLESKIWERHQNDDPDHKGYEPQQIGKKGKTVLAIKGDDKVASLVEELETAGVPYGKVPGFKMTDSFKAVMALHGFRPKEEQFQR